MNDFLIRKATFSNVKEIVRIHEKAFPHFFLTSLGSFFLRTYYHALLKSSDGIAFILLDSKESVIGFSAGTLEAKNFHKRLIKKSFFSFSISALIIIISQPLSVYRLLKNLDKKSSILDDGNYSELLSIGIEPCYNGKGLGKALITAFEEEVKNKGGNKISLTTDFFNNEDVVVFYKRRGYQIMTEFIAYPQRKMYRMIKFLD